MNNKIITKSLAKIQRDYRLLPKLIQKSESSKYTISEAYADISALDLKQDCVVIGAYIKKRMLENSDMADIVNLNRDDVPPCLYAEIQCCHPTSAAVERSFSMLGKLLRKDRPFLPENVQKYLCLYYNKE